MKKIPAFTAKHPYPSTITNMVVLSNSFKLLELLMFLLSANQTLCSIWFHLVTLKLLLTQKPICITSSTPLIQSNWILFLLHVLTFHASHALHENLKVESDGSFSSISPNQKDDTRDHAKLHSMKGRIFDALGCPHNTWVCVVCI